MGTGPAHDCGRTLPGAASVAAALSVPASCASFPAATFLPDSLYSWLSGVFLFLEYKETLTLNQNNF